MKKNYLLIVTIYLILRIIYLTKMYERAKIVCQVK